MHLPSVLVSVCLLMATSADRIKRQSDPPPCQDADDRRGICGDIEECPHLNSLIFNRTPSESEFTFLRGSVCGFFGRKLHVCCSTPEVHPSRELLESGPLCGTNIHQRIRGGTAVPLGKYPWVALLGYTKDASQEVTFECGGSLIGPQHVLTAAHCVTELPPGFQLKSVRLGEQELGKDPDCQVLTDGTELCNQPQNFGIQEMFVHESYNLPNQRDNDIALLKLDRPVVEDGFVGKVCLPFDMARHRDYAGVNMSAAGFGRVGPNSNSPTSNVLLEVVLPGVEQEACGRTIRRLGGTLGPAQVCAGGEQGRDSCGGDSGGPLIAPSPTGPPYSLIGVISFGARRCGEGNVPSVNARVSEYLFWILDRVR